MSTPHNDIALTLIRCCLDVACLLGGVGGGGAGEWVDCSREHSEVYLLFCGDGRPWNII